MDLKLAQSYVPYLLPSIGISPRRLEMAIATIKEFFSEQWLDDLQKLYASGQGYKTFKHPIYSGMLKGEVSVETPKVIELSSCLERLRGKTNLAKIVNEMKDPETFVDYFYQLSTAYRLSFLDSDIQMEPLINGKTPDNVIEFQGRKCVIECTVMSGSNTYAMFHDVMEQLSSFVSDEAEKQAVCCNIYLFAKHESVASPEKLETMKAEVKKLITQKTIPAFSEIDCCIIKILPIQERPDKYQLGMTSSIVPAEAVPEMSQSGKTNLSQVYQSGFFVNYEPIMKSLHKDLEKRVYNKIEEKRKQVKPLKSDHDIFLFIDTDVSERQVMDRKEEIGREIVNNFLSESDDLFSLIVLTNRPRGENHLFAINRFVYGRSSMDDIWLEAFFTGFMEPSVNHNFFLRTTGRNDPCPCGIGLKFKHCHGFYST